MGERRMMAGAVTAPLCLLVLLVPLAACGGGGDPVADPPVSPSSTSSSPVPPRRESPQAFIRRGADADIQMQNSGKTAAFRSLSMGCNDCTSLADRVDRIYKAGGYIHTDGWAIRRIEVTSHDGTRVIVNLHVISRPTKYRQSASASMKSYPGGPAIYQLTVRAQGGSWNVESLGRLES